MRLRRAWLASLALAATCALAAPSEALLAPGDARPPARVVDADGRVLDLDKVQGKPALVVYEDKGSSAVNTRLKSELSRVARGDRYRAAVALVPVADVRGYDYWPVRGFVKDAIRGESKKLGATIYCDWDGSFGKALGIKHGTSTVVLIDRSGRVVFAHEGKVPDAETRRLLDLLRAEVEPRTREPLGAEGR